MQTFATVGVAVSKIAIQLEHTVHGNQMVGQQEMGLGKSQKEDNQRQRIGVAKEIDDE